MFWMTLYLFAGYCGVALALILLRGVWAKPSPLRWLLFLAVLLAPLLPYAAVALQTACFGNALRSDIRQAMLDSGMSEGRIVTLRILSLTPWGVKAYVTEPCRSWPDPKPGELSASVFRLKWTPAGLKFSDWGTVWSDCGSAEGNTFPPYPEAREF